MIKYLLQVKWLVGLKQIPINHLCQFIDFVKTYENSYSSL